MNRISLIQEIFQKTNFQNYLEIGCESGKSFLPIKARNKIAVDPNFKIPLKRKLKWIIKQPSNLNNKYFEEESDIFFSRKEYLERLFRFDVVLVDGLHTFRASLNDVLNSLKYLNKIGVIIMHDCLPPSKEASMKFEKTPSYKDVSRIEGWNGIWCGDVWKTIIYLRRVLSEIIDVSVINTDFGLGIIKLKNNFLERNLTIDETEFLRIDKITYEELLKDTESMLGLKNPEYVYTIIDSISIINLT